VDSTQHTPSSTVSAGAPRDSALRRALAPDLARGMMLLLIAIANSTWYLWGHPGDAYSNHPTDGTILDRILRAVMSIAVDGRIYPMFAFLFGYGMVQFARSRQDRGVSRVPVRRMLRRRHWALVLFGFLHAALLFAGDILGAYGVVALALVWIFFERSDKVLKVWVGIILGLTLSFSLLSLASGLWVTASGLEVTTFSMGNLRDSMSGNPDYLSSLLVRLADWVVLTPFVGLLTGIIPAAILVGWLLARHRVLEEPAKHRRGLVLLAAIGIAIGWLGGVPTALAVLGRPVLPEGAAWAFISLTYTTGLAAGLGYVALFALVALRIGENPGRLATAIAAVGKRSLSFYLFQSILFAPLLTAWGLGLGSRINTTGAVGISLAIWAVSVLIAGWMEATHRQGPFEIVLRRLTHLGPPDEGSPGRRVAVPPTSENADHAPINGPSA
jgi:uncharacterized protein